jgi:membrane protease YdiL (CAAX protease family)
MERDPVEARSVAAPGVAPGWRLAAFVLVLVVGGFLIGFLWRAAGLPRRLLGESAQPLAMFAMSVLLVALALASTCVPLRWLDRRSLRTVGLGLTKAVPRHLLLGIVGGGLTPALIVVGFLVAGAATVTPAAPDLLTATLPTFGAMALISSWEEIVLRGYLMQLVAEMGGPGLAACLSGAVFGLLHAGNPGANPMGLAITAVNGVLLALLVVRTGSLWLACGYHAGWNLVAAIGFGLRDSGTRSPGAFATTDLHGSAFWTGGGYGFEASIAAFAVEALVLLALLRLAPRWAYDPVAQPYYATGPRKGPPALAEGPS